MPKYKTLQQEIISALITYGVASKKDLEKYVQKKESPNDITKYIEKRFREMKKRQLYA